MNPYLEGLRAKYQALQDSIKGLQTRASAEKRDLTDGELRSVVEMGEQGELLYKQIKDISEIEVRNAEVASMTGTVTAALSAVNPLPPIAGSVNPLETTGQGQQDGQFRSVGGAQAIDRDPGVYRKGGQHSFLADQFRSQYMGDTQAGERLLRSSSATRSYIEGHGSVELRDVLGAGASTGGAGLVPPVYLAEYFAPIMHKKLRLAAMLRQVPWAGPFAWTIPVASTQAKTSSVAEGVNTTETDPTYVTITVTPKAIMGYSEVSRQMLEAANPAVDTIVWGDLVGDFYDNCELEVISALNAQSGVNTATVSAGSATTGDILAQRSGILDGIAAIADAPAGDPNLFVGRTSRWTTYLEMQDTTGRPLILAQRYNPQNAIGAGGAGQLFGSAVQGELESLGVVTSPTVAASTGFILNSDEQLFSVSAPMQFSFEQPAGPALIRIGVWGYEAVTFARRPKSITKITYSGS